jgi:hypothetical protein
MVSAAPFLQPRAQGLGPILFAVDFRLLCVLCLALWSSWFSFCFLAFVFSCSVCYFCSSTHCSQVTIFPSRSVLLPPAWLFSVALWLTRAAPFGSIELLTTSVFTALCVILSCCGCCRLKPVHSWVAGSKDSRFPSLNCTFVVISRTCSSNIRWNDCEDINYSSIRF